MHFLRQIFTDPHHVVESAGYIGLFIIVFAETGALIGLLLPGDSLLIAAGVLAATGHLNIFGVIAVCFVATVLGNESGYLIGRKVGPALRNRRDGRIFKQKYIKRADRYYERYGSRTILIARFIPFVRTFGPIVAGMTKMKSRSFLYYNVVGGAIWSILISTLGYTVGKTIPNVDKYLLPTVIVVVGLSLIPSAIEIRRETRREAAEEQTNHEGVQI